MYERLKSTIDSISIVDAHCHVGLHLACEQRECTERERPPFKDPFLLPQDSKTGGFQYQEKLHYEAYEKIYGFQKAQLDDLSQTEKLSKTYDAMRKDVVPLAERVMDIAGIDYLIGNIAIPKELENHPRIGFIPRFDCLLVPFDNTEFGKLRSSEQSVCQLEWELKDLMKGFGMSELPKNYSDYLCFVDSVLAKYVKAGYPGWKCFSAYIRSTLFDKEKSETAEEDFLAAKNGDLDAYLRFQNRIMWHIVEKSVEYDKPIQFHMAMVDGDINATNPLNFQVFLQDNRTANAKLVILHGGYPHFEETTAILLAAKPRCSNNIFVDISGRIMFSGHPKVIAEMLHKWLIYPPLWDKICYGSDMIYGERVLYTCAKTGRLAVFYALSDLIDEDIIDEETAITIAKKILRNNSIRLYHLDLPLA